MGIGVLAYVGETVGHELLGHGSVCVLGGGRITALAPLFMRCSNHTIPMVVAGPAFNFLAAGGCALALRARARVDILSYFLWLSCGFNLLVACGYLIVGGATTFGDWGVVFASTSPQWLWRAAIFAVGAAGYFYGLRLLGRLYAEIAGPEGFDRAVLQRRTLLPGIAAAAVAGGAEFAGGHPAVGTLALTLGCTVFVGWCLSRIGDFKPLATPGKVATLSVPLSVGWLVVAAFVSAGFVGLIGPVALF
jgi:hypothetical protein